MNDHYRDDLMTAIRKDDIQEVQKVIWQYRGLPFPKRREGNQPEPLDMAVDMGNLEIVECLLKNGALPDTWNVDGYDRLAKAVKRNKPLVELLFKYGATADIWITGYRDTGLHEAVRRNDLKTLCFLLSKGANANIRDFYSRTPIDLVMETYNNLPIFLALHPHSLRIEIRIAEVESNKESYTDEEIITNISVHGMQWYEQYQLDKIVKTKHDIEPNIL